MLVGIARELFMTTPPNLPLIGEANGVASSISAKAIKNKKDNRSCPFVFAVWTRLELATPCVTGRYSNQLNYHTVLVFFQRDKGKNIF